MNNNDNDEKIISIKTKNSIDDYYVFIEFINKKFLKDYSLYIKYLKEVVENVPSLRKAELNVLEDITDKDVSKIINENNIHVVDCKCFSIIKKLGILKKPSAISVNVIERKVIPSNKALNNLFFKDFDTNKFKILTKDNKSYVIVVEDLNDLFILDVAISYLFNHITEDFSPKILDFLNSNIGGSSFEYTLKPILMRSIKDIDKATIANYERQDTKN